MRDEWEFIFVLSSALTLGRIQLSTKKEEIKKIVEAHQVKDKTETPSTISISFSSSPTSPESSYAKKRQQEHRKSITKAK